MIIQPKIKKMADISAICPQGNEYLMDISHISPVRGKIIN